MLAEVGYEGITIEAVAHAAGVSKNAIYRRWPDKVSMVLDTLEHLAPAKDHGVDTGDIRADMATMLRAMAEALRGVDGRLATALASDITRHPELAEAFRARLVEPRREELEARVRRAVEAGQLPADSDVELLTGIGPALLYHRMLFDGVAPDDDYVDEDRRAVLELTRRPAQQPHMPPQQPPPEGRGADDGAGAWEAPPTEANIDSSRREPTWPCGHSMGSEASAIGRRASKVSSQMGQRYS